MGSRHGRGLVLLVVLYGMLLWVVASAASRRNGFAWVLLGSVALGFALRRRRRGRPQALYRLCFVLLLAAVTALGAEGLLWLDPGLVTGVVANKLYSRYHVYTGGMYERDRNIGHALRPSFHAQTYWNGHWWRHDTNAQGFRGPEVSQADVVFLGDSMIYGHGVDTDRTVPARFGALTGRSVANLGQESTGLLEASVLLRRKGLRLQPRLVFVCSHPNDSSDETTLYAPDELRRFLADGDYVPVVRERALWPKPWYDLFEVWTRHLGLPLRSSGLAGTLAKAAWDGNLELRRGGKARPPERFVPSAKYVHEPFPPLAPGASPELRLGWEVQRQAVALIHRLAKRIGARVVLFDIGYPLEFSRAVEGLARDEGLEYSPAGRAILDRVLAGEDLYLADDGHWNPAGTDAVARELARYW